MPTKAPHDDVHDSRPKTPIDWRLYLAILWERRWVLFATFSVIVGLTALWLVRQTPTYRATAQVLVELETLKVLNIQDVLTTDTRDLQYVNTQVRLLQSHALIGQAAAALHLDTDPTFRAELRPEVDSTAALEQSLTISADRNSRLIKISADHWSPALAARLANGVAEEFIRENLSRKLGASLEALTWLRQQADEIKPKLAQSEAALLTYREENHAVSLEDRQNIVVDKLKELSTALTKAHTERLATEAEWTGVEVLLTAGRPAIEIPTIVVHDQVGALLTQLTAKQIALASLKERYKDDYPSVVTARAELHEMAERLTAAGAMAVNRVRSEYRTAQAKEDSLEKALREQEQQALGLDRKLTAYNALKRDAEADRQLYDSILNRMKETSVAGKLETNNIRLVDPAIVPLHAMRPRKAVVLALGLFFGLAGGIFLSLLVDHHDDRIKTFEDLQSLGTALLSTIPSVNPRPTTNDYYLVDTEPHSMVAEHFRDLRTSLMLQPSSKNAQVFIVTSSIPGEGKTFVAANLATVFAHSQKRTLIIDCDLRNPSQHRAFPTTEARGLSALLTGAATWEEVVQATQIPGLDILPAGCLPANPLELLGSSSMKELLSLARQRYDRVVIDTPPVGAVSDALILLPLTDGVIFVIQFGKLAREFVARTLEKLQDCGAPVVGAVLNDIDLSKHKYYYPYRNQYSHYYQQPPIAAAEISQ